MRIAVIALILGACGGGHAAPPSDAPPPGGCTIDPECSAPTPACDTTTMQCVQCTDTNLTACTGATPACVANTCAACSADTDCAPGVCLADGTCVTPANVLWVTRDVTAGTCTQADKCTLAIALSMVSSTQYVIHLDPLGYTFPAGFVLGTTMTIAGIGASIAVANDTVFNVNGGVVKLDFVQLGGTLGAPANEGIECTNATLMARKIGVAYTSGIGINASGCYLRLERSTLHDNTIGALLIGGGAVFDIFDNMIDRNGSVAASSSCGGVELLGTPDPSSRLEFNTIVDNQAVVEAGNAGGVICDQAGFVAANNIISRNGSVQTFGACTYPTSIVQADLSGLALVSPDTSPYDYHLTAGSTAIDQATTTSDVVIDIDDDFRPQGPAKDIGADEYKP